MPKPSARSRPFHLRQQLRLSCVEHRRDQGLVLSFFNSDLFGDFPLRDPTKHRAG